jgi:hypothetical protein
MAIGDAPMFRVRMTGTVGSAGNPPVDYVNTFVGAFRATLVGPAFLVLLAR